MFWSWQCWFVWKSYIVFPVCVVVCKTERQFHLLSLLSLPIACWRFIVALMFTGEVFMIQSTTREKINRDAHLKYVEGRGKVFIVDRSCARSYFHRSCELCWPHLLECHSASWSYKWWLHFPCLNHACLTCIFVSNTSFTCILDDFVNILLGSDIQQLNANYLRGLLLMEVSISPLFFILMEPIPSPGYLGAGSANSKSALVPRSAFSTSGGIASRAGALPTLSFLIASMISSLVTGPVLMSKSSPSGM